MKTKRKCPLCNATIGEKIFDIPIYMKKIERFPEKYDIVACKKCGMLYADSFLTIELLDKYYSECNMYDNVSNVIKDNTDEVHKTYYKIIEKYIQKEEDILEVGCGDGNELIYLKNQGYNRLSGLDPSEESIEIVNKNGINGYCGSVYTMGSYIKKKFETILSICVFEHLLDLHTSIKNILSLLKTEGQVFVVVPCAEGFSSYIRELPNYFNIEHINYFTRTTMDRLFQQYGFGRITSDEESIMVVGNKTPELMFVGVYKRLNTVDLREVYDATGKQAIYEYLEKRKYGEHCIEKKVEKIIASNEEYIMWGTGNFSAYLLKCFPKLVNKISFFVDNNEKKFGEEYFGKKIYTPKKIKEKTDAHILICSMLNADAILNQIKEMNMEIKYTILKY